MRAVGVHPGKAAHWFLQGGCQLSASAYSGTNVSNDGCCSLTLRFQRDRRAMPANSAAARSIIATAPAPNTACRNSNCRGICLDVVSLCISSNHTTTRTTRSDALDRLISFSAISSCSSSRDALT